LYEALADTGLPVEASSGGRTKYNRTRPRIAKTYTLDAACVGEVGTLASQPCARVRLSNRGAL
jgi:hypothetical protein